MNSNTFFCWHVIIKRVFFRWSITTLVRFSVIPAVFCIFLQCFARPSFYNYTTIYWQTLLVFLFGHISHELWRRYTLTLDPTNPCPRGIFPDLRCPTLLKNIWKIIIIFCVNHISIQWFIHFVTVIKVQESEPYRSFGSNSYFNLMEIIFYSFNSGY